MAVILAVLSGIRLRNYIIIIFLATFAQMLQGYNIEASVARGNAKSLEGEEWVWIRVWSGPGWDEGGEGRSRSAWAGMRGRVRPGLG